MGGSCREWSSCKEMSARGRVVRGLAVSGRFDTWSKKLNALCQFVVPKIHLSLVASLVQLGSVTLVV